jgi:hypothetical protein
MKKQKEPIYTLTESQLIKLVKKVISEQQPSKVPFNWPPPKNDSSFSYKDATKQFFKSLTLYLDKNNTKRHRLNNELHVIVKEIQTVESRDHDLVVWMYYGSSDFVNAYRVAFKWRCEEGDLKFKELDGRFNRGKEREFISSFYNIPNPTTKIPPATPFYNLELTDYLRNKYCKKNRSGLWVPVKDFAQSGTSKTDNDNIA